MFADDTVNTVVALVLLLGTLVCGMGLYIPLRRHAAGTGTVGGIVGVRTARTTRSQEAWQYSHQAGMFYWKALPWVGIVFCLAGFALWQYGGVLVAQTAGFLGAVTTLFVLFMGSVFARTVSRDRL